MDVLDANKVFAAVVRANGFTAAAKQLGVPLPTVSRKVSLLEDHLGAQLLTRTTRSISLTGSGERYFQRVTRLLDELTTIEREAAGEFDAPVGQMTITSPTVFGYVILVPIILDFLKKYSEIRIRHIFRNVRMDYIKNKIDLGLEIGEMKEGGLRMVNVGQVREVICASPEYLDEYGTPRTFADWVDRKTMSFSPFSNETDWRYDRESADSFPKAIGPRYEVDSIEAMVDFAAFGGGIGQFYSFQILRPLQEGRLKIILADEVLPNRPVSLVYPADDHVPLKVRTFIDFAAPLLRRRLANIMDIIEAPNHTWL